MDKIISLPDSFMTLLGKMHGVFTEPSFFYFTEFVKGILISPRKAVTRFYLIGNHLRHFTDYHRFLNHALCGCIVCEEETAAMVHRIKGDNDYPFAK